MHRSNLTLVHCRAHAQVPSPAIPSPGAPEVVHLIKRSHEALRRLARPAKPKVCTARRSNEGSWLGGCEGRAVTPAMILRTLHSHGIQNTAAHLSPT